MNCEDFGIKDILLKSFIYIQGNNLTEYSELYNKHKSKPCQDLRRLIRGNNMDSSVLSNEEVNAIVKNLLTKFKKNVKYGFLSTKKDSVNFLITLINEISNTYCVTKWKQDLIHYIVKDYIRHKDFKDYISTLWYSNMHENRLIQTESLFGTELVDLQSQNLDWIGNALTCERLDYFIRVYILGGRKTMYELSFHELKEVQDIFSKTSSDDIDTKQNIDNNLREAIIYSSGEFETKSDRIVKQLEIELSDKNTALEQRIQDVHKLSNSGEQNSQEINKLKQDILSKIKHIKMITNELQTVKKTLQQYKIENTELTNEMQTVTRELANSKNKYDEMIANNSDYKQEIVQRDQDIAKLQTRFIALTRQKEMKDDNYERIFQDLTKCKQQCNDQNLINCKTRNVDLQQQLEQIKEKMKDYDVELKDQIFLKRQLKLLKTKLLQTKHENIRIKNLPNLQDVENGQHMNLKAIQHEKYMLTKKVKQLESEKEKIRLYAIELEQDKQENEDILNNLYNEIHDNK